MEVYPEACFLLSRRDIPFNSLHVSLQRAVRQWFFGDDDKLCWAARMYGQRAHLHTRREPGWCPGRVRSRFVLRPTADELFGRGRLPGRDYEEARSPGPSSRTCRDVQGARGRLQRALCPLHRTCLPSERQVAPSAP